MTQEDLRMVVTAITTPHGGLHRCNRHQRPGRVPSAVGLVACQNEFGHETFDRLTIDDRRSFVLHCFPPSCHRTPCNERRPAGRACPPAVARHPRSSELAGNAQVARLDEFDHQTFDRLASDDGRSFVLHASPSFRVPAAAPTLRIESVAGKDILSRLAKN